MEEGTIGFDAGSLKMTAIEILICENIYNLAFDFRMILKDQEVDYVKFIKGMDDFISQLFIK